MVSVGAGRGTLSGSGAVRPGPNTPFLKKIVWGGVGGLVVNCIVDASIYNM